MKAIVASSPESRQEFIRISCERNTLERVEAFLAKIESGLTPVKTEANPRWEAATFELGVFFQNGSPKHFKDPYPYRYNDDSAGERHLQTGRQQPECVPIFLTVWSDGSKTECLWDDPI